MKIKMQKLRKKFPDLSVRVLASALVQSYLLQKNINFGNIPYFKEYFSEQKESIHYVANYICDNFHFTYIDDLINTFELLIDNSAKKENGIIYTPLHIKEYIIQQIMTGNEIPYVVDPACGCGSFLITAAQWMHKKYQIGYQTILEKYIEGFDIDARNIEKAEILFNVLALQEENTIVGKLSCFHTVNSLEELFQKKYRGKYDIVLGNPPYIRARNIEPEIKPSLKYWSVVTGNTDLYIPFYQLACVILKSTGKLGFISPNTFLQSVNGRGLRNYLVEHGYAVTILDFRETQAFRDVTHYTCICLIDKSIRNHSARYALLNGNRSLTDCEFTDYDLQDYEKNQEWRFSTKRIDSIIKKIEHQPHKLNDFKIRNGLATLCNDIYFFSVEGENNTCYYRNYGGKSYPIEKDICIDIAKPNIMRTEADLENKMEKAIFPYDSNHVILEELYFKKCYPMAYAFLYEHKDKLLGRDKGNTEKYPAWYAYGRTQGMNNQGKKLLIPYMAEKGVAIKSDHENVLFYCGYALFCDDDTTLDTIKCIIESDVFWYYIRNTSKPYAKGYMALAKNYIKNFGLPEISKEAQEKLLAAKDKATREKIIAKLYDLPCDFI